ncbi:MAG: hypothetical protein M5U12_30200 [Verrucomicrobia bacterium]|nr:hypothetical protein [Verrucomicrobiota bacterium]
MVIIRHLASGDVGQAEEGIRVGDVQREIAGVGADEFRDSGQAQLGGVLEGQVASLEIGQTRQFDHHLIQPQRGPCEGAQLAERKLAGAADGQVHAVHPAEVGQQDRAAVTHLDSGLTVARVDQVGTPAGEDDQAAGTFRIGVQGAVERGELG